MRLFRKILPWIILLAAIAIVIYIPEMGPDKYTDFATLFRTERARQANAGFSVAVTRGGRTIYSESFGVDGLKQPLYNTTPMYLGPASEILSGALLYSLTLDNKMSLDSNINTYLPQFPVTSIRDLNAVTTVAPTQSSPTSSVPVRPQSTAITVRQLAAHRVNFQDVINRNKILSRYDSRISGLEAGVLDPELLIKSRIENNGTTRSRLAYRILASAMENAGHNNFDALLQDRLLVPLHMYSTTTQPSPLHSLTVGSGLFFGLAFPYDSRVPQVAAPADGIITTAEDISRFLAYITAPRPDQNLRYLPANTITGLYQPLFPNGDTGFGWRIQSVNGDRLIFQGGSIEGFSSRIVIWPERNASIVILSSQGGVIQSNIVLPLLTDAAERLLFKGSTPPIFPVGRALVIVAILSVAYLIKLCFQIATSFSWARALSDQRESSHSGLYARFSVGRTIFGVIVRILLIFFMPYAIARITGRTIAFHDLFTLEPSSASVFIAASILGILRNISRLTWVIQEKTG
jgi:CubicO group peptidase (beta-lactamase class C family)